MTEPITKFDDVVETYFESGSARLRLKEYVALKPILYERINEAKILIVDPLLYIESQALKKTAITDGADHRFGSS